MTINVNDVLLKGRMERQTVSGGPSWVVRLQTAKAQPDRGGSRPEATPRIPSMDQAGEASPQVLDLLH